MTLAEALAARTEALCAVRSPIGEERALCDEVERQVRGRFAEVRRVKNSLVVLADGAAPSGRPLVALCGHLDTVPIHAEDEGRFPRREGGRLYAPGASDMKGGVAVALELAERLPAAERFCDLALVLYSREEGPFEENELGDVLREVPEVSRAALALCLEPTDNALQLGCVGSMHATLRFTGRSAHSARPWQGENAVHKAGELLRLLHRLPFHAVHDGGLEYREVMSVTRIEGGRARNVVPDQCTANLNFRFAPGRSLDSAAAEVEELARRVGAEATITDRSPSCPSYADHPLVRRLRERSGARLEAKQAWTDVARLAQAGVPAANLGPGATAQAHQAGEWLDLAELERSYLMLERFLRP
ncbi:succinyl-diaminopimelate desuccinylase [Anaeromyxobacter paludicola]|uniref:Succinyl-diaminopimelate desuccinylase n=1 Tax=Anaeromyxobacter paludicola TaxID=2918171 RepID=A0ABN6NAL4_9BACT|nr:succinyl-diaminopimelate desuccinylase [Anaeromyxobacter paludicola]BDG10254.1 putative succinyl-diaminopimelate desuccinylase DapE [Anaeromyxobacter paludicola]